MSSHASPPGRGRAPRDDGPSALQFCAWVPLAHAAGEAPDGPGVFQIRVRHGLIAYPRGKSAMIQYGVLADLGRGLAALAQRHPAADWLCRHLSFDTADAAHAFHARLLSRFITRFGAAPRIEGTHPEPGDEAGREP